MLQVKNISFSYNHDLAIKDVNFALQDGEKVGLVGVNGAGKSTLLKVIGDVLSPTEGVVTFSKNTHGVGYLPQTIDELNVPEEISVISFMLDGRPLEKLFLERDKLYLQMSKTTNEVKLNKISNKLEKIETEIEIWGGYSAESELMQILVGMDFDSIDLDAKLKELSGGQKSKVVFARMLYSNPDVLLLDEPTNHLDKKSRIWVMEYLQDYPGTVLAISHDPEFLDSFVTKIIRIDEFTHQAQVFPGNYSSFLKIWEAEFKSHEKKVINQEKEIQRLSEFIDKYRNVSGKRKKIAQSREKSLEKLKSNKLESKQVTKTAKITLTTKTKSGAVPVKLVNVSFSYDGVKQIINNANLNVSRGERIVVLGVNGAGKTTLLKILSKKISPTIGSVEYDNKSSVAYYSQELEDLNQNNSVISEVLPISGNNYSHTRKLLSAFLFSDQKINQKVGTLSPGERSRLALAKIAATGANLLILDEPTNHLDVKTQEIVANTLREYGGTLIVISHDLAFLENLGVDRMIIMPEYEVKWYNKNAVLEYQD